MEVLAHCSGTAFHVPSFSTGDAVTFMISWNLLPNHVPTVRIEIQISFTHTHTHTKSALVCIK